METVQQRIRRAREDAGLTQEAVANHFGITRNAVSQWEKDGPVEPGSRPPTSPEPKRLPELAKLLKVDLLWLLTGVEAPPELSTVEQEVVSIARQLSEEALAGWIRHGQFLVSEQDRTPPAERTYAGDRPFGNGRTSSTSPKPAAIEPNPTRPTSNGAPTPPPKKRAGRRR